MHCFGRVWPALFAIVAFGQTGEIRLSVTDPSGAAMDASGRLQRLPSGAERRFQTEAQGVYTFTSVPYGRYQLEVSRNGFATQSLLIDVESAAAISRTVTMALGPAPPSAVTVVATTPLAGVELEVGQIAAPVQTANQLDIENSAALDLSDFLNRRLNGVHLNEIQGNPVQADLNYRGYTASPLLGTPQGLSIYMDGVRLNQPFGDVVSWDLIPRIAIAEVALMPGSNPLFGLNTLGGAVSITTKDGRSQPGATIEVSGGSYGRRAVEFEYGGSNAKGLNWYVAGNLFHDDGWRDDSPSDVRQALTRLGWQGAKTTLGLTLAYANNKLFGNGLQEERSLERSYGSVYTKPDITDNHSPFLNFSVRHVASTAWMFAGNIYYRDIRTRGFTGDINEDSLDQSVYQPSAAERMALAAAGYTGVPTSGADSTNTPFPFWRCIGQVLLRDEPGEKCNGLLNRTYTKQRNYGVSGQATWLGSPGGHRNQFTAGTAYDRSSVNFTQSSQLGYLNPDRSITGLNAFGDGVSAGTVDGEPFDTRVNLHGTPHTGSLYATDTLSIGKAWNFTLSWRYNRTVIDNTDRVRPGGGPGSLNGHNVFDRFNPSAGVTFNAWRSLNAYFGYSEGSRAPTSIELGCADPDQPCKLPNALAGDPPLDQVVTRTWESGLRGGIADSKVNWSAGWFRADNRDDILFVASQQTGFGYFKNFGKTRRQGVELDLNSRVKRVSFGAGYTYLGATYQSPETVIGESNSSNDAVAKGLGGFITIRPGNRIPLIPRNMLKAFADIAATSKLSVDLAVVGLSGSYARGNENNLHQGDGQYYLGSGRSPGYATVNLGGRYQLHRRLQLFVQLNNLFDHRYYTAAQLGPTGFSDTGAFLARPLPSVGGEFPIRSATFYAPGAPRMALGGIRVRF